MGRSVLILISYLSILKKRIIQITGYRSDFITRKSIDVELDENNGRLISVIKQAGAVEIGRDLPKIKFIIKL